MDSTLVFDSGSLGSNVDDAYLFCFSSLTFSRWNVLCTATVGAYTTTDWHSDSSAGKLTWKKNALETVFWKNRESREKKAWSQRGEEKNVERKRNRSSIWLVQIGCQSDETYEPTSSKDKGWVKGTGFKRLRCVQRKRDVLPTLTKLLVSACALSYLVFGLFRLLLLLFWG